MIEKEDFKKLSEAVSSNSTNLEVLITKIDSKFENLENKIGNKFESFSETKEDLKKLTEKVVKTETALEIISSQDLHPRIVKLEQKWWWVMGAIAASGALGGIASALISWGISLLGQ